MKKIISLFLVLVVLLASNILGVDENLDLERQQRLIYGKVVYVKNLSVNPTYIPPGDSAVLDLTIENVGDFSLKDVIVELDLPSQFSPDIGDTVRRKMRLMPALSVKDFEFNIKSLPSSEEGVYSFPLVISYLNQVGDEIEETSTISLFIGSEPEIVVLFSDSEIHNGNVKGKITLDIVNKGLTDVKFLTIELLPNKDYKIISSNIVYIGDVDSDDFESADFDLKLLKESEKITLPLKVEYRDANNRQYSEQIDVLIDVPDEDEVKERGISLIIWIIVVILIIGGYIVYRKTRKTKSI